MLILDVTFYQRFCGSETFDFLRLSNFLYFSFWKIDIDECAVSNDACSCASQEENPSCNATCVNNDGSYNCECSDGYKLYENDICIGKLCRIFPLKSLEPC